MPTCRRFCRCSSPSLSFFVGPAGLEPATLGLKGRYATIASRTRLFGSVCFIFFKLGFDIVFLSSAGGGIRTPNDRRPSRLQRDEQPLLNTRRSCLLGARTRCGILCPLHFELQKRRRPLEISLGGLLCPLSGWWIKGRLANPPPDFRACTRGGWRWTSHDHK